MSNKGKEMNLLEAYQWSLANNKPVYHDGRAAVGTDAIFYDVRTQLPVVVNRETVGGWETARKWKECGYDGAIESCRRGFEVEGRKYNEWTKVRLNNGRLEWDNRASVTVKEDRKFRYR
jgi:hypothetical protein